MVYLCIVVNKCTVRKQNTASFFSVLAKVAGVAGVFWLRQRNVLAVSLQDSSCLCANERAQVSSSCGFLVSLGAGSL